MSEDAKSGPASPGITAFVGNPPFLGGSRLTSAEGPNYTAWLAREFGSKGQTDLCAYFFRRCADLLSSDGAVGMLATNSIAQGDTRLSGLKSLLERQMKIFAARRNLLWPGTANVVASLVHLAAPGLRPEIAVLDGQRVATVNSRLWPGEELAEPVRLVDDSRVGRLGVRIDGPGFLIGHNEYTSLLERDRRNAEILRPYLGGDEQNQYPDSTPTRWVIDFGRRALEEAAQWPELLAIIEERVKPAREKKFQAWWRFDGGERFSMADNGTRHLAATIYTKHLGFTLQPANIILNSKIFVVAPGSYALFAVLQSRLHVEWAWLMSSTIKSDLAYSATECFETFPLPGDWRTNERLAAVGRDFYEYRAELMKNPTLRAAQMGGTAPEGLTATLNRFHDPTERFNGIRRLRAMYDEMDQTVLEAYGWPDLKPRCDFFQQTQVAEDDAMAGGSEGDSRYQWTNELRDEVLARLLHLNTVRSQLGGAAKPSAGPAGCRKRRGGRHQ